MRFKISINREKRHKDVVSCIGWSSTEEVYSISDDQKIFSWKLLTGEPNTVASLPTHVYAIDLHFFPRPSSFSVGSSAGVGSINKRSSSSTSTVAATSELFVLGAADGNFHLINKNGRFEKSIQSHQGAVLSTRWSHDGSALATGGEDGQVKIWSQTGMLRSTLAQTGKAVYSLAWNSSSSGLLYTIGKTLVIKSLQPSSKPVQWAAHDGLILKVSWNPNNNLIVSGGEDCKYKLWDPYGRPLYSSSIQEYPITSLAWTPDGELFAVGSFNTLRLCDRVGWSHSLDKPDTGSIFNLAWSSDGTQVAGACGNGNVIFAHIVERRLEWKNFEVEIPSRKLVLVRNVADDTYEKLELQNRVLRVSLCHRHLVLVTSTQCLIYSIKNWNTPTIIDLKEGGVTGIIQAEKHFLLIEGGGVMLYSYEGKLLFSPRWPGMRPDVLNNLNASLNSFTLAIRDQADEKAVHLFDISTGKVMGDGKPIVHEHDILVIALDQCGSPTEQYLAFIDKNSDLYVAVIRTTRGPIKKPIKLGVMVQSICWNDNADILAALQESKINVWFYPNVAFTDRSLISKTSYEKDLGDFGKNPQLVNFLGNHVNIRRADGSLVASSVSPFPSVLQGYVSSNRWDDAVRLCRSAKDSTLWSCLAAMATHARHLNTAEIAYAAIDEVDKVEFLQRVSNIGVKDIQLAEMSLMCGNAHDAEALLLQGGHIFRAIMLNISLSKWDRALELAQKHRVHLDTVLVHRQRYLGNMEQNETNQKFKELMKSEGDSLHWEKVKAKIDEEYLKEADKGSGKLA